MACQLMHGMSLRWLYCYVSTPHCRRHGVTAATRRASEDAIIRLWRIGHQWQHAGLTSRVEDVGNIGGWHCSSECIVGCSSLQEIRVMRISLFIELPFTAATSHVWLLTVVINVIIPTAVALVMATVNTSITPRDALRYRIPRW